MEMVADEHLKEKEAVPMFTPVCTFPRATDQEKDWDLTGPDPSAGMTATVVIGTQHLQNQFWGLSPTGLGLEVCAPDI